MALVEILRAQMGPSVANDAEACHRFFLGIMKNLKGSGLTRIEFRVTEWGSRTALEEGLNKLLA